VPVEIGSKLCPYTKKIVETAKSLQTEKSAESACEMPYISPFGVAFSFFMCRPECFGGFKENIGAASLGTGSAFFLFEFWAAR
jgi:hypothetical protein